MRRILKKFDKSLLIFSAVIFGLLFASSLLSLPRVFANSEESSIVADVEEYHVTIFDGEKKLIVKTSAKTVAEVLSRAEISLGEFDSVDPSLETTINADNFFINIHRSRPALIIDGAARKFSMTSSFDPKAIAEEAGLTIYDGDRVSPIFNSQFLELGVASVYQISRGNGSTLTVEEEIPFAEETQKDFSLGSGKSEVIQLGEVGSKTLVYSVKTKNGVEISRELVSETVTREPVSRITRVGADPIEMHPLTAGMGRNRYTVQREDGSYIERQETYYDLDMSLVMKYRLGTGCGNGTYSVRGDGVKIDNEGYVLVAANLDHYPLCSVVQTSLGIGKVYDTGTFASINPEQFDIATDWTNRNGR